MLAYLSILSVPSTFTDPVALIFVTLLLASELTFQPIGDDEKRVQNIPCNVL